KSEKQVCGHSVRIDPMRPAALRDHCLSFPGSVETFPSGPATSVFKVAGKTFAVSRLAQRPLRVSLKCEPQLAEQAARSSRGGRPGVPPEQETLEHRDH